MSKLNHFSHEGYVPAFGKSFIRLPRKLICRLFEEDTNKRLSGWLYFTLVVHCFHSDGLVKIRGKQVRCNKGQLVCCHRKLSDLTNIPPTSIGRLLQRLADEQLITVEVICGGSRISVTGYAEITRSASGKEEELTASQQMAAYEERLEKGIVYA